jgi:hypothetical protein
MQTPLGYHPGPQEHTMVPLYSPGLPLLMAAGLHLAGTIGPYLVVPISAAVYVWFTFLLGRRAAGSIAGVFAAVLVATSPAVLFQTMSPMSDVPSGALWTGATVAALGGTTRRAMLSGLLCALGLLVRPNLAVLALVPIGAIVLDARGAQRLVRPMLFAVPVALAALFVAYLNVHWHGSALQSGYGPTADLYSLSRIWPNLQRYPVWLWQSQSPWIVVALLALVNAWRPGAGRRAVQASWVLFLLTAICYLSYFLFDEWWYLRFLLPGLGAFFVLVAVGLIDIARRVSRPWGQVAAAIVFLLMLKHATGYALAHSGGFGALQAGEHRYPDVGAVVSAALPDNAVVFTMQHSGSLRFYGGRMTLRYDWVEPEWAARAVPELERMGLHPYLVIEDWEVPDVQKHFALAPDRALPWPQLHENGYVSLYDMATNPAPQPRIAIGAYTAPRYSAPKEMVLKPH